MIIIMMIIHSKGFNQYMVSIYKGWVKNNVCSVYGLEWWHTLHYEVYTSMYSSDNYSWQEKIIISYIIVFILLMIAKAVFIWTKWKLELKILKKFSFLNDKN